ncbi:SH3 domain-containing protein [Clostridium botulinum]|uniref:SH3 domain-containing protein n=1 Tax=Clostridium botulinum TaxID=1491 RepID=UPI00339D905F
MIKKKFVSALAICSFLTLTYGNTVFAANNSTNNAVQNKNVTQTARKLTVLALGKVTADVLNVRQSPSTSSNIIGQLDNGTHVSIVQDSYPDWYKIEFGSGYGWVSKQYIRIIGAP